MRLLVAAVVVLVFCSSAWSHNVPGSRHNRVHAINYAFCHSLRPCARGDAAVRTFECESPGLWPWARNGQYLGFAQMGVFARSFAAQHGSPWSWGIWQQARSAAVLQAWLGWAQWECAYIVGVL